MYCYTLLGPQLYLMCKKYNDLINITIRDVRRSKALVESKKKNTPDAKIFLIYSLFLFKSLCGTSTMT